MPYNASLSNATLWTEPAIDEASGLFLVDPNTVNTNSRFQYRHHLLQQYIDEKAVEFARFKAQGQIPPTMILLCKSQEYAYEWDIVYGAYRCLAAAKAQTQIWAQDGTALGDRALHRAAVSENLLRQDPNTLEMTEGILQMITIETGLDQAGIKALLQWDHKGRKGINVDPSQWELLEGVLNSLPRAIAPRTFYKKYLPLLSLPAALDAAMRSGELDYTKALELKKLPEAELGEVLEQVLAVEMSFQEVKQAVENSLHPGGKPVSPYKELASQLGKLKPDTLETGKRKQLEGYLDAITKLLGDA